MRQYKLTCINQSGLQGAFCLFWHDTGPASSVTPLFSLAWLTKTVNPKVTAHLQWDDGYCLVWGESGKLKPGMPFMAGEKSDADPNAAGKNGLGFSCNDSGFFFCPASKSTPNGKLGIYADSSIPDGAAAIGVGIGDKPALVCNALPNLNYIFELSMELWAVFGDLRQGEVLDCGLAMAGEALHTRTNAVRVVFGKNIYEKTLTLHQNNTLTVS